MDNKDKSDLTCVLCNTKLTKDNETYEHIIPNAIGGKIKVPNFICRDCNSNTGNTWDAALAQSLLPLCSMFGVTRERGTTPDLQLKTQSGQEVTIHHDQSMTITRPKFSKSNSENGLEVQIEARNEIELRRMLSELLKKIPHLDVDELIKLAEVKREYLNEPLKVRLGFGGEKAGKSIVKTILAYLFNLGIPPQNADKALKYLLNNEVEACFKYFYSRDLIKNRPSLSPIHCISIRGDKSSGVLVAYLEYFGVHRVMATLSTQYEGDNFHETYAINPQSGENVTELEIDLCLSDEELCIKSRHNEIKDANIIIGKFLRHRLSELDQQHRNDVVSKAISEAFQSCGVKEGQRLTKEDVEIIKDISLENLEPYLLHLVSSARKGNE